MLKTLGHFLLLWAGATAYVLFTTKPADGIGGPMEVIASPQFKEVLAQGFYYGALCLGFLAIINRRKQVEDKNRQAETARSEPEKKDDEVAGT